MGTKRKTKNVSDNYIYRALTIFITQYINTAILFMLAYHSFVQDPRLRLENKYEHVFVGPFDEFNMRWYLVVGTPIVMVVAIQIFVPHIGLIFSSIKSCYKRCRDRKCSCNKRVTL